MRIHLLAPPNAPTTKEYSLDGFTQATIRFARMMRDNGAEVFLYCIGATDAPGCVSIMHEDELKHKLGSVPYQYATPQNCPELWKEANRRMIAAIELRKQPRDFICTIGGYNQKPVTDAHPDLMDVEYSIGYPGSYARYRVFESNAWRNHSYGRQNIVDNRFFDETIPLFFDPDEFTPQYDKEPFALYVGRLVPSKGIKVACQAAKAAGIPLKVIGHGDIKSISDGAEYIGPVGWQERNDWMARAAMVLCPTTYIEPFGAVAVEAQLCGTPVIATDAGGFTETVWHGVSGYRARYLGEFVYGMQNANRLDTQKIRKRAVKKYSMHDLRHRYRNYFHRLELLWDEGWNTVKPLHLER